VDVVVERVRSHFHLQRAGRRVQDAVRAGIKEAVSGRTASWLLLGVPPESATNSLSYPLTVRSCLAAVC